MSKFLDTRLFNILQLSLGISILFMAVQTEMNIQETVIHTYNNLTGAIDPKSGYYSLAVSSLAAIIFNFFSAPIVELITEKWAMVLGAFTCVLFLASFLKISTAFLYSTSIIYGAGCTLVWVGFGEYLTKNSDEETIGRNSAISWVIYQGGLPIGGIIIYTQFRNVDILSLKTINIVFISLSVMTSVSVAIFALLRQPKKILDIPELESVSSSTVNLIQQDALQEAVVIPEITAKKDSALKAIFKNWWSSFVETFRLLKTVPMLLLAIAFTFTGLEISFATGVYGTCLSFTQAFGDQSKALLAINIIFVGIGEIVAGSIFGIFSQTIYKRVSRSAIVFLGMFVHLVAFLLIFLNLPLRSPFEITSEATYINSNKYVAIFCSFLLGFADSCWNTQIYSFLGAFYSDNSASAFALFNFFDAIGEGAALFYCAYLNLGWQLLILVSVGLLGAFAFAKVDYDRSRVIY